MPYSVSREGEKEARVWLVWLFVFRFGKAIAGDRILPASEEEKKVLIRRD